MSDELDITWTIVPQDSALVIRTRKGDDLVIRPTFADAFQGGNLTSVRFTRGAGGRVSGFTISAGRVRGVTFVAR